MKKSVALLLPAIKKLFFFALVLLSAVEFAHAQQKTVDSLKREISRSGQDTAEVVLLNRLSTFYTYSYPDSALQYDAQAFHLAQKLNFIVGEIWACDHMGEALGAKGEFANALETDLKALHIAEKEGDKNLTYLTMFYIGGIYNASENYQKSLNYLYKSNAHKKEIKDYKNIEEFMDGLISLNFFRLNKLDSAAYFTYRTYKLDLKRAGVPHWYVPYNFMGDLLAKKGEYKQALYYYRQGLSFPGGNMGRINSYNRLASVYVKTGPVDSAIYYSKKSIGVGRSASIIGEFIEASQTLIDIYQSKHLVDSAFKFQKIEMDAKDSLFSKQKIINFQTVSFKETERDLELRAASEAYQYKVKIYSLIAAVAVFIVIGILLWRNNNHKQKANLAIQKTLAKLQQTQTQLIQSEKMASLGELTAGIAHEIQNPLNFVKNFSEVNRDMIGELEEELKVGNISEALAIATDIKLNEEKINHHSKRADFIVKGMLEHSRMHTGERQLTDINVLADEFLKLSYHGLRAKDKSFNAEMITNFDRNQPKANIVQQDIGRVLLNLYNNAFYSVWYKKKKLGDEYKPTVVISTAQSDDRIIIQIRDNGAGIPQKILDKIYQPFFTTKPTGEGTGLGLSLSYDIIKAHGGEMKVETAEGEFAEFTIVLPIS